MIKLRDFAEKDIDPIVSGLNNFKVVQYLSSRIPYPHTREDAKWWVETGCRELGLNYAIDVGGQFVGVIGVNYGEYEYQFSSRIGYWIIEEHWGKGIGTEALEKMTEQVFSVSEITRIWAPVFSLNLASMRVLERCGYQLECIHHNSANKNGEFLDEHIFVKFRS